MNSTGKGNHWRNCSQEGRKELPVPEHPTHIQRQSRHCSESWAWLQPCHNCYLFLLSARHTGPASQGKGWRLGDCKRKCFLLWNTLFRKASKELPKAKKTPQRNNLTAQDVPTVVLT